MNTIAAVGIAGIERLERRRHEVERIEAADAEPDIGRDPEVADRAERDLADVEGRAVMAAGADQLVVLGMLGAAEQGPAGRARPRFRATKASNCSCSPERRPQARVVDHQPLAAERRV